jgi:hypothetical protein
MSTPGWCMSHANQVMPWCLGASGLVRAISMPMSAIWPPLVHTFCPLTIHSSPSLMALQPRPARSLPAPGSLNSWHHACWPVTMGSTYSSICSWVPCTAMVGAASSMPSPPGAATAPCLTMRCPMAMASLRGLP